MLEILLLLDSNLSQLILVPLIRAEAESGGRDCGEGGGQHRAHGGAKYNDLERTAVSMCQEIEGEGTVSSSSVISCLRALGGRITEHAKITFRLGVLRALAVASTHYIMDLQRVSSGYMVPNDASPDTASAIMDDADATVEGFATVLAAKLEADIPT